MRCFPELTLGTDVPAWVTKSTFYETFDQTDFFIREIHDVEDAYLGEWFYEENGETRFLLPTVGLVAGRTQFINGRHRTAVLLRHLDELPIAFAVDHLDAIARGIIGAIPKRPLNLTQHIFLPDLPVKARLP